MSDEKKGSEQLSVDERLAKLQQRRMGAPEIAPVQPPAQQETNIKEEKETTPVQADQSPMPVVPSWQRAGQPLTHDRRSRVPFGERYFKDNIMIDKRLLVYYFDWMSKCRSKVEGANAMLLEFLISKGYEIDPHLLDRPFTREDLPPEQR